MKIKIYIPKAILSSSRYIFTFHCRGSGLGCVLGSNNNNVRYICFWKRDYLDTYFVILSGFTQKTVNLERLHH